MSAISRARASVGANVEEDQFIYTPARVLAILDCLYQIEACAERGTVLIHPASYRASDGFEKKVEAEALEGDVPAPSVRRNVPYRIDDAAAYLIDVNSALDKAILPRDKKRIILQYAYGYTYDEIAVMEGDTTEVNVRVAVHRAIEKMADWLNTPKKVDETVYQPREGETYRRKYAAVPAYSFNG